MDIIFLEPAEAEFDEAVAYYNHEQPGLGEEFNLEIQRSLLRVANYPESYQNLSTRSRRCLVTRFPYGIIYQYRKEENKILVVARSIDQPNKRMHVKLDRALLALPRSLNP